MECATTGIVIFTFLGACASVGQENQPSKKTAARKIVMYLFIAILLSILCFCQSHFGSQITPEPLVRGAKLLAFMDLKNIPWPSYRDIFNGLDLAGPGSHEHDPIRQGNRFDQIVGDKNNGFSGRR